jgi:C-terminal processing protease CtpA/Prc
VLGVVVGPDLRIVDVDPGGAAERSGLRRGDVLTKIGSQALPAPGTAPAGTAQRPTSPQARPSPTGAHITAKEVFRREVKPGQPLALSVRRNGQTLDLQITPGGPGAGRFGGPTPTGVPQDSDLVYF